MQDAWTDELIQYHDTVCWKPSKSGFRLTRSSLNCLINNLFNLPKSALRPGKPLEKALISFVSNFLFWSHAKHLTLPPKLRIRQVNSMSLLVCNRENWNGKLIIQMAYSLYICNDSKQNTVIPTELSNQHAVSQNYSTYTMILRGKSFQWDNEM